MLGSRFANRLITLGAAGLAACGGGDGAATASPPPPSGGTTAIAAIQGAGDSSPHLGQRATIEGVVSGDFQDGDVDDSSNLGGFFVQSEDPDGNPETSDGVFVFDGDSGTVDVLAGDRVRVTGTVQEFFGETQLAVEIVQAIGRGTIMPTDVPLQSVGTTTNSDDETIADLERFEGMLVRFPDALTVAELRNLERFGSMRLAQGGRLYQYTNQNAPDPDGYRAHRDANAMRSVILDDGRRAADAAPVRYLDTVVRIGDSVTDLTGNLRYSRGSGGNGDQTWRVMPTSNPMFVSSNPRPAKPNVDGSLRVVSFNVLNYFSTIDRGDDRCGPAGNKNCRGADSAAEQSRQLEKIATALTMIDADIVGLIELENNTQASLTNIVDALNTELGAGTYAYVDTGIIGDDTIKTGFIYKSVSVTPTGNFALLTNSVDPSFNDERNRPVLAQTFSTLDDGSVLTVVVNHLKSKGSDCDADDDPNTGDGQGNCNLIRSLAATAIADWLADDPTSSGDPDFLIIGDLNAYLEEDPLAALKAAGYVNLVEIAGGADAYSFVFDGQSGALDHALASPSLADQINDVIEWHINADEPRARDYNLEHGRDPALFDGSTPYRASDHDPVIVGIDLN